MFYFQRGEESSELWNVYGVLWTSRLLLAWFMSLQFVRKLTGLGHCAAGCEISEGDQFPGPQCISPLISFSIVPLRYTPP